MNKIKNNKMYYKIIEKKGNLDSRIENSNEKIQ